MKRQGISKKSITVWQLRATLVLLLTAFLLGALYVFLPIASCIIGVLCLIAYILIITVYFPMLYKNTGFWIENNRITIEHGFFIKRKYTLSSNRVQYIITIVGPIQKVFGLCTISFMTAGSTEILQNITFEDAAKIKKALGKMEGIDRNERKKT